MKKSKKLLNRIFDPDVLSSGNRWNHKSCGFNSKEELFKHYKMLPDPCVICLRWVATHYHEPERMIAKNMCFGCNLWDKRSEQFKTDKRIMVVDHQWYTLVEEFSGPGFRGFGGREFIFKVIATGEIKPCKNVWFGGDIPKYFHHLIPDNAILLKGSPPFKAYPKNDN